MSEPEVRGVAPPGAPLASPRAPLEPDPFATFARWYAEAQATPEPMVEAAALATCTLEGRPSVRMVLLRGFDERGFVFFTNYESRKGAELTANPFAALCFHWHVEERQVRIEGRVERVSREESEAYFATRPYESRLGAWASAQSRPLAGREQLVERVAALAREHPREVPCPPFWGGYRIAPDRFEFWVGEPARLHDRFLYSPEAPSSWTITRLSP